MKIFISTIIALSASLYAQSSDQNIDQFKMNVFVRPVTKDSIEVLSFLEFSNKTFQFIKKDRIFEADYEGSISVLDSKSEKKSYKSFVEKITVQKFADTTSNAKKRIIKRTFVLPIQNYTVVSSLKDLDIKLSGKKDKKIELKKLTNNNSFQIYDPIFVKDLNGSWGFKSDKFPIDSGSVIPKDDSISFYQYIVLDPGEYNISLSVIEDKKVRWKDSIKGKTDTGVVSHLVVASLKDFGNKNLKVKVVMNQGNNTYSRSFPFKIKNFMSFDGIDNIDIALIQMGYILTSDEKRELKKLKNLEKENFFRKVWEKRDPDPNTEANELMEEYYTRVLFTEENFSSGTSGGWRSDMGMVYILFGKPDDVSRSMNMQGSYNYQTWYYFEIGKEFTFIDDYGFGDYRLRTPLLY